MSIIICGIIALFVGASICVALGIDGDSAGGLLIVLLCVLVPIIGRFIKKSIDEEKRQQFADERRREIERIKSLERHLAETTQKVEDIIRQYTPVSIGNSQLATKFSMDPSYINKEVAFTVRSYKERMAEIYDKYSSLSSKIGKIVSCPGCQTIDEKYSHLTSHMNELKRLKNESDECIAKLSSSKIELLNADRDLLLEMNLAFNSLLNSKKCLSENGSIQDFITSKKPDDLMLFKYDNEPITLFLTQYYFCLFSNVILVFDSAGIFTSAIDPSAFSITTRTETISVTVNVGRAPSNQYIAEDSKCVSQGVTRSTWLHTCRDGSPDLRYSYNPRLEYQTNTYEYAVVEFVVAGQQIAFSASSSAVGESFEKVASMYTRKCNNRHNPIPEFLQLIKSLNNEADTQIDSIIQVSESKAAESSYFCRVIAL